MAILKIARLGHPILFKKAMIVKKLPNPQINLLINVVIDLGIVAENKSFCSTDLDPSNIFVISGKNPSSNILSASSKVKIEILFKSNSFWLTKSNNLPPNVPEWTSELGEGVDANPYGMPSEFEKNGKKFIRIVFSFYKFSFYNKCIL